MSVAIVPCEVPRIPRLRIHVDANRDGTVDDAWEGLDEWRPADGIGAVILVNNDDDNASRDAGEAAATEDPTAADSLDNTGTGVDGANDVADVSRLEIRRHPRTDAFPDGWTARLTVDQPALIRIFNGVAADSVEIIGPAHADPFVMQNPGELLTLGMEGISYPKAGFPGHITVTLETLDDQGDVRDTHRAKVRVAPWIAAHHGQPVERVYVITYAGDDEDDEEDDEDAAKKVAHAAFVTALTQAVAPIPVTAVPFATYRDTWFRDAMLPGFSSMPTRSIAVIAHSAQDRNLEGGTHLDRYPWCEMVGREVGYVAPRYPFIDGESLDSLGNVLCSPPVTVNGRAFRFGRLIYGRDDNRPMDRQFRQFLYAQQVQAPFALDTGWLTVGHVDELITFVPMASAPKGFKVVIASPRRAVSVLRRLRDAGHRNAPFDARKYGALRVRDVLASEDFDEDQQEADLLLARARQSLCARLGLDHNDFVYAPVLFRKGITKFNARTPNLVNMLVATRADGTAVLCVPKPFGPTVADVCQFEAELVAGLGADYSRDAVQGRGRVVFLDAFTYHDDGGEIHCGTNERRTPPADRWWWQLGWIDDDDEDFEDLALEIEQVFEEEDEEQDGEEDGEEAAEAADAVEPAPEPRS